MKLTKAQERAKGKLTAVWQCAEDLQENLRTLELLVTRNVAKMKGVPYHDLASENARRSVWFKLRPVRGPIK